MLWFLAVDDSIPEEEENVTSTSNGKYNSQCNNRLRFRTKLLSISIMSVLFNFFSESVSVENCALYQGWCLCYCTVDVFAIFSPVFSLRIFYKKHAKNHTSNKPRAFKICVQLSFDKLIWYTKFHKDWSTRRQKHHWSKFFDGLVKYRTENRKTVHCAVAGHIKRSISRS